MPDESTPPKVLWAIPNQGWLHKGLVRCMLSSLGPNITYALPVERPIENNRNKIVKEFLAGDFTYLLMTDDDTIPLRNPLETLPEVIGLDLDMVCFPTPMWKSNDEMKSKGQYPMGWNIFEWAESVQMWRAMVGQTGLVKCDAGGTGCLLIHRRVLEHPEMKAPFMRDFNEDGIVTVGSDLVFSRRARALGFQMWANFNYRCRHVKELEIYEIMEYCSFRDIAYANNVNINTPEYWDEQWETRPERILPYYEQIAEMCRAQVVLDYGCGRGDLLAMLAKTATQAEGADISAVAVAKCGARGLDASQIDPGEVYGEWDTIVATELLEHVDKDEELLHEFFEHTDRVIYAVPYNCLPPSIEPEHRRVYTRQYVERITPYLKEIQVIESYLLVVAEKE